MNSHITPLAEPRQALDIARCFIKLANSQIIGNDEDGRPVTEGITNLKLQKLLYFAQATHLALFGKPLFNDEIQAWSLGPVIPSVYRTFKVAQNGPINANEGICNDPAIEGFVKIIWELFGKYSASELVEMTHRHHPWKSVYQPDVPNIAIPQDLIRAYYKESFSSPSNANA